MRATFPTGACPEPGEHLEGPLAQHRSGQPAGAGRLDRGAVGAQGVRTLDGRVRRADAVEAELEHEVGDRVDVVVGQVGRDLDDERDPRAAAGSVAHLA